MKDRMKDSKNRLFKDLEKCNCENRLPDTYPFYFEMKQQKVMLITLVPSFQAVYRHLASIRFFRQIFLALCGAFPNIDSGKLVEEFLDSFYWTHYHKCYLSRERGKALPEKISSFCYKKYIEREIRLLKPSLIVVLGNDLVNRLFHGRDLGDSRYLLLEKEYFDVDVICANFPKGSEAEFVKIREKLSRFITWVDSKPVPKNFLLPDPEGTINTIQVHAQFEKRGLHAFWRKICNTSAPPVKKFEDSDDLWIDIEVMPRWERYAFIILCFLFLEDQCKVLIAGKPTINKRIQTEKSKKCRDLTLEEQFEIIARGYNAKPDVSEKLKGNIAQLRILRNHIAHVGGRITPGEITSLRKASGLMLEPSGMVYVTRSYCQETLKLVDKFVEIISEFET